VSDINNQSASCREASFEDCAEATELLRSLGLSMPDTPEAINAHWRRLWVDNPALAGKGAKQSLGWVLEKQGHMAGFFCYVPLLYYFGDRRVTVSVASQWGLEKNHRGKIHQLAGAYFGQSRADITIATTANRSAGRIFQHYGADRIPQPDYDQALYWIIDGGGFVGAAMKKNGISTLPRSILSAAVSPLAWAAQAMGWRMPKGRSEKVDLIGIDDIDAEFDDLWLRKRDEAERLLACRTAECLRWHFGGTQPEKNTRVLVHDQGRLRGYGVVMREDVADIGLKRFRIADLFVENNDRAVVNDLLCAAYEYGREQGCHVLEWVGMSADMRQTALGHSPFVRTLPTWPLFYRPNDDGLSAALKGQDAWYITPYDGDTTLA